MMVSKSSLLLPISLVVLNYLLSIIVLCENIGSTSIEILTNFFIYNFNIGMCYIYSLMLNSPLIMAFIGNISKSQNIVDIYYYRVLRLFLIYNYLFIFTGLPIIGYLFTGLNYSYNSITYPKSIISNENIYLGIHIAFFAGIYFLYSTAIGLLMHFIAALFQIFY